MLDTSSPDIFLRLSALSNAFIQCLQPGQWVPPSPSAHQPLGRRPDSSNPKKPKTVQNRSSSGFVSFVLCLTAPLGSTVAPLRPGPSHFLGSVVRGAPGAPRRFAAGRIQISSRGEKGEGVFQRGSSPHRSEHAGTRKDFLGVVLTVMISSDQCLG